MDNTLLDVLEDMGVETEETLDRLMGDEEFYLEYLYQFPENQNIIDLKKAVTDKDYVKAEHEVHALKGVALNLGLLPLMDACMDMLMEFREGNPEKACGMMGEVEESFKQFSDVIGEYSE